MMIRYFWTYAPPACDSTALDDVRFTLCAGGGGAAPLLIDASAAFPLSAGAATAAPGALSGAAPLCVDGDDDASLSWHAPTFTVARAAAVRARRRCALTPSTARDPYCASPTSSLTRTTTRASRRRCRRDCTAAAGGGATAAGAGRAAPPPVAPAPAAASNSTFAAFDTDGDGTISSPELHRVFEAGDRNANGSLSVMETRRSLKGMGLGIDNEVMSEFNSADTNEDGELQYEEFKRLVGHLTDDESLKA